MRKDCDYAANLSHRSLTHKWKWYLKELFFPKKITSPNVSSTKGSTSPLSVLNKAITCCLVHQKLVNGCRNPIEMRCGTLFSLQIKQLV